jgi:hypothetical protein
MQTLAFTVCSFAVFSVAALSMQAAKQERFSHPVSKDADGGMARWMQVCKPSAAHARLAELVGNYDVTVRMSMGNGAPSPNESKGTCEFTWLVEGKWLTSKWNVDFMGQKDRITTILGYDNFKERYVWCKVDSMQTTLETASGLFDKSGDNLILWGTIDEPMTPEQDKQVKYVFRNFGKDKWTLEIHDMMIGETNTKVLEFELARKK